MLCSPDNAPNAARMPVGLYTSTSQGSLSLSGVDKEGPIPRFLFHITRAHCLWKGKFFHGDPSNRPKSNFSGFWVFQAGYL